jgi:hypothetical protein
VKHGFYSVCIRLSVWGCTGVLKNFQDFFLLVFYLNVGLKEIKTSDVQVILQRSQLNKPKRTRQVMQ